MPQKILVLEDDVDICSLVQSVLAADGYDVVTASSVARAMTIVRNQNVDLAVVDIMMPVVDGYQFCSWLRNRPKNAKTPIIIITAHEERYGRERAEKLGVGHFINKPFDPEQLKIAVRRSLAAAAAASATAASSVQAKKPVSA